jgi:hypothetical protein
MRHCEHRLPGVTRPCNHEAAWWVTVNGVTGVAACRLHLSRVAETLLEQSGAIRLTTELIWETAIADQKCQTPGAQ